MTTVPYESFGPEGAPLVLLSPSLGTHADAWSALVPELETRNRLVLLEHRGHGGGDVPAGPYTIDDLTDDVLAVVERLGGGRFSYIGLSLGAMVGIAVAARLGERLNSLVLCCTSAYLPPAQVWTDRAALVRAGGMAAVVDTVPRRWFSEDFLAASPATLGWAREQLLATPAEGYAGCCEAIATMDLRPGLATITARTLVIAGELDAVAPASHAAAIAEAIPGAQLVVLPAVAHLAPVQRPDLCAPLFTRHLESTT